jgi:hypothetical protein
VFLRIARKSGEEEAKIAVHNDEEDRGSKSSDQNKSGKRLEGSRERLQSVHQVL